MPPIRRRQFHGAIAVAATAFLCAAVPAAAAEEPAYVIFTIMGPDGMGSAIGLDEAQWDRTLRRSVEEIRDEFGPQRPGRKRIVGFSVALMPTLNLTPERLKAQVVLALDLAERLEVPVFFHLDDQHFWWLSPELSKNPETAEWSDFPKAGEKDGPAVPRYWLPWGDPPSVYPAPPPCMACPAFRAALAGRLREDVGAPIAARLKAWNSRGKGYLLAGVASGNETAVPDYRACSRAGWPPVTAGRDWTRRPAETTAMTRAEMAPIGYHSLYALGYDRDKLERLARGKRTSVARAVEELFYGVARDYAEFQARTLNEAGVPRERLYTHFTSSALSTKTPREERCAPAERPGSGNRPPPVSASVNRYSRPGFTIARDAVDLDELVAQLGRAGAPEAGKAWAAAESYPSTGQPGAPQTREQYEEYLGGLLAHGARVVNVYGWNIPWIARSPYRIKSSGVIPAVQNWLSGAELPRGWSGAREQAQLAAIRDGLPRLPQAAREAILHGRNPLAVRWIVFRFQRQFEPLVKAGRYEEAAAVLDRALDRLHPRP